MTWEKPSECTSFWSWLFWEWDMRSRWDGPYILWRKRGYRIFGFVFEYEYKEVAS